MMKLRGAANNFSRAITLVSGEDDYIVSSMTGENTLLDARYITIMEYIIESLLSRYIYIQLEGNIYVSTGAENVCS